MYVVGTGLLAASKGVDMDTVTQVREERGHSSGLLFRDADTHRLCFMYLSIVLWSYNSVGLCFYSL